MSGQGFDARQEVGPQRVSAFMHQLRVVHRDLDAEPHDIALGHLRFDMGASSTHASDLARRSPSNGGEG